MQPLTTTKMISPDNAYTAVETASPRDSVTLHGGDGQHQPDGILPNKENKRTATTIRDLEKHIGDKYPRSARGYKKKGEPEDVQVFEEEVKGDINYHCLKWWQAGMLMIAETISLGILSIVSMRTVTHDAPELIIRH